MDRRRFLAATGAAGVVMATTKLQAGTPPRVGVLWHAGSAQEEGSYYSALNEGFRELGYVDGRNVILEHRFPNEMPERFRSLASELVALPVDVLITVGSQTAAYAKEIAHTTPVVFVFVPDPIGSGFAESFARPGRNMTGLTLFGDEIVGKRLQYLKEIIPELSTVGVLINPNTAVAPLYQRATTAAAHGLGLRCDVFEARSQEEVVRALDQMAATGLRALTINPEGLAYQNRSAIATLARERKIALAMWSRETFEGGALMSYGPDQVAMCRRAPAFVDKILKGTKPGDLPVEQPTTLQLFLNLRVAHDLELTVPPSLLVQATAVIE